MQLIGIQIIALFFALFMLYISFLHFKKGELSSAIFLFWILLWLVFIFLAIFPQILEPLLSPLKIVRVLDLLMVVAFVILTFVTFENHVKNRNIEKKIEDLARSEALKKINRGVRKNKN